MSAGAMSSEKSLLSRDDSFASYTDQEAPPHILTSTLEPPALEALNVEGAPLSEQPLRLEDASCKARWSSTVQECLQVLYDRRSSTPRSDERAEHPTKVTAFVNLLEQLYEIESFVHELAIHRELESTMGASPECLLATEDALLVAPKGSRFRLAELEQWLTFFGDRRVSPPLCLVAQDTWRQCYLVLLVVAIERAPYIQGHWLLLDYLISFMVRTGFFQQAACSACLAKEIVSQSIQMRGWQPTLSSPLAVFDLIQTRQILDLLFLIMRAFLSMQALEYAEATLQLCEQILKRLQTLAGSETGQPNTSPRVTEQSSSVEQREIPVITLPRSSSSTSSTSNNNNSNTDAGSFPGIETGSLHATTPTLGAQGRFPTGALLASPVPSNEARPALGQRALEAVVQASRAMLLFHRGLLDSIRGAYEDGTDAFDAAVILCESLDQGAWDLSASADLQGALDGTNRFFTALSVQDWVRAAHNNSALCSLQTEDLADALEKLDRAKRTNASLSPRPASAAEVGTVPLAAQPYRLSDWEGCCVQKHYAWIAERVPWELQHVIANADLELSSFVQQFEDTSLAR